MNSVRIRTASHMRCSRRQRRFLFVVATARAAMQSFFGSAAAVTEVLETHASIILPHSSDAHAMANRTSECVPSMLWSHTIDASSYEFGCDEIKAMLAGTEDVPRLGTAREVLKVEYEGRSLVVKRVHSSWVNSPDVDQRRARKLARREQVAFDTVRGHPNVARMLGVCGWDFVTEDLPFGVSEFIQTQEDDGSPFSWIARIVRLALDVARGVQALHEAPEGPIVHFGMKAQQVRVDEQGVAKIDELRSAWFMDKDTSSAEEGCPFATGPMAGGRYPQPMFRSPECLAQQPLTEKVDMYSLAIVFYEMLYGREQSCDRRCNRLKARGVVPEELRIDPDWHRGFVQIMQDMWNQDPSARPSAGEVVSRLEVLLEELTE